MNIFYKNIVFLIFISLFLLLSNLSAGFFPENAFSDDARGTVFLPILKSPVTPKYYSLGTAGSLFYSGENIFYNPAGAYTEKRNFIYLDWQTLNADSRRSDAAYLINNYDYNYGFSVSYIDYGEFIKVDENGVINGSFSPYDVILNLHYSRGERSRFGVNFKYINSDMIYESVNTFAFDIGFLLMSSKKVYYSLLFRNISPGAKIDGKVYPLPFQVIGGIRYDYSRELKGLFELRMDVDEDPYAVCGLEYTLPFESLNLHIRGGFDYRNKKYLGWGSVFSGGLGFEFNRFAIDYAFIPYSDIDMVHKLSVNYSFGELNKKEIKEKKEFEKFIARNIKLKKRIAVLKFFVKNGDSKYGVVIRDNIENELLRENLNVVTSLDPQYIRNFSVDEKLNLSDIAYISKKMGLDYTIYGKIEFIDKENINASIKILDVNSLVVVKDIKIKSNIYDFRVITKKVVSEFVKL